VVVWLKAVGESITAGEPVLEVQSDKANVEVESTLSGTWRWCWRSKGRS
jgi:pyruvate dehydrogenase E2 component (dihydrolipoamide acetyltransferase)